MKKYKSEALEALHESMGDLYKAGGISEERMREFDNACLVKPAAQVTRFSPQKSAGARHPGTPAFEGTGVREQGSA